MLTTSQLEFLTWGFAIMVLFGAAVVLVFSLLLLANYLDHTWPLSGKDKPVPNPYPQNTPVVPVVDPTCECGCKNFYEGPSGGMMTNISCADCGTWYNIAPELGVFDKLDKPKAKVS